MYEKPGLEATLTELAELSESDFSNVVRCKFNSAKGIRLLDSVTLDLDWTERRGLALLNIEVDSDKRGQGLGSRAMTIFLATVDKLNAPVELFARPHDRSPLSGVELEEWYERLGFEKTDRGHERPSRSPRPSETHMEDSQSETVHKVHCCVPCEFAWVDSWETDCDDDCTACGNTLVPYKVFDELADAEEFADTIDRVFAELSRGEACALASVFELGGLGPFDAPAGRQLLTAWAQGSLAQAPIQDVARLSDLISKSPYFDGLKSRASAVLMADNLRERSASAGCHPRGPGIK